MMGARTFRHPAPGALRVPAGAPPASWNGPAALPGDALALPKTLRWIVAAYIFLLPVQIGGAHFNVAPSDLFILLFVLLGLGRLRFVRPAWSAWHVALLAVFAIGTFISGWNNGQLSKYVFLNKGLGLLFLIVTYAVLTTAMADWSAVRPMLRIFVLAVTLHVIAGTLALFLGPRIGFNPPWMNYYSGRLSGMLIDPNAFGGLALVALAIQATTFFSGRPVVRGALGLFAVVALAAGLLLTLSRSAWLGFALALLFSIPFRPRMAAVYAVVGLLAAGVLYFSLGSDTSSRVIELADRRNTAEQRLDQIRQAIPMFSEHPVFGAGLGGFQENHGWIIHDSTVWMLTEFGLVGLTAFLGFLGWFLLRGIRAHRLLPGPDQPLILGLMCAHVGMFGVSFGIEAFYQRHWWLVMAVLASVPAAAKRLPLRRTARAVSEVNA